MLVDIIIAIAKIAIVLGAVLTTVAYLSLAERRISAFIQRRLGPNRVGPWGMLQPLADGIKFFFKEDVIPGHVDKLLYVLAPAAILVPALMAFAVVPFGDSIEILGRSVKLQIADLNVGLLYVLAISSLGVYGVVLGGWSSNNKYSLLGGLRASAQMISYELPLGLSVIGVLMLTGSLRINDIVASQTHMIAGVVPRWNVLVQPLGFLIFAISAFAETNRLPFDLPEAEQELVAGYHSEYSSIKFASFYMAEYANMITSSALMTTLFFGGWHVPWIVSHGDHSVLATILGVAAFAVKTGVFLFMYIWVRWTIPRFRYDQLMRLGWKILLPVALLNVLLTATGLALYQQ